MIVRFLVYVVGFLIMTLGIAISVKSVFSDDHEF